MVLVAAAGAADAAGQAGARDALLAAAEALDKRSPTYYGAAWVALGRIMLDHGRPRLLLADASPPGESSARALVGRAPEPCHLGQLAHGRQRLGAEVRRRGAVVGCLGQAAPDQVVERAGARRAACSRADGGSALMWAHILAIPPVSPANGAVPISVSKRTQASP